VKHFEAILFDVDDTLFDRRKAFARWANRYIAEILSISDPLTIRSIFVTIAFLDGSGYGSKNELIKDFLAVYPPPGDKNYAKERAYADFVEEMLLDKEAAELLDYLDAADFPYGIVTNGGQRQIEKVNKLGLTARTECIFISKIFGCAKPNPKIFLAAAKSLGHEPSKILFIGDHPINDIFGAHIAGMQTAWLHKDQPWPENQGLPAPDITLSSVEELLGLVGS
jgi:putative hydrolase of the HAD superfamily